MDTLLLDRTTWDLVITSAGDIAVASNPYSLAQDAACACRTFNGELYYNTEAGVPKWIIMNGSRNLSLISQHYKTAAESVPDVASAKVYLTSLTDRTLSGQIQITSDDGDTAVSGVS